MATAASRPAPQAPSIGAYDRLFYSSMAVAMALTVLIGFAPTYYLRLFTGAPAVTISGAPVSALAHLHAILFSGWVLLFIVQTALVASHRVAVHRRLGIFGALLAAAMVVVGTRAAIAAAARGSAPPGADPLAFLAIPLADMVLFPIFVGAALWQRRQKETHKRLMLLAYISIIAAAVARLPGLLPLGPLVFFGLAFVFLFLGVIYDLLTRRRVHAVYLWGGALLVVSVPLRLMISGTAAWRSFAEFLTR